MKYLLFRGDPAGLSNVKMGFDIGVGLAHLTNRVLVVYENDPLWEGARPIAGRAETAPRPTVFDLFDVPVPYLREEYLVPALPDLSLHRCNWSDLADAVYYPPDVAPVGPLFEAFRNGRRHAYTLDEGLDDYDVIQIDSRPLAHYSHFFYLPDTRRRGLLRAMTGVRAKEPYREFARDFAAEFAAELGPFNAVHLRRTDTKWTTPRNGKVTGEEIVANLSQVFPTEQALLICTDESSDTEFFAPILAAFPRAHFLDRLLLEDPAWAARLRGLPYASDPVLAVVTQLVATHSDRFAGSLISTFTALIQRMRGQRKACEPFLFAFDQFAGIAGVPPFSECQYRETGPGLFSWNRLRYPMEALHYTWIREWPEAFSDEFGAPAAHLAPASAPPSPRVPSSPPPRAPQPMRDEGATAVNSAPPGPIPTLEERLYALHTEGLRLRQRVYALEVAAKIADAGRKPRMPVEFRSQYGEDLVIWEILGGQTEGFFVEVGAYDGYQLSVTYGLEAAGWRGLLIEAIPERCDRCRIRRPYSRVVNAAVSRKGSDGTATFVVVPEQNGLLSYLDQDTEHARFMALTATAKERITVPLRTIDGLLDGHEGPIDAAIIDVEGAELDVLDGFDIERWRPRVLFLEDNSLGRDPALGEYMAAKPYVRAGWLGVNRLYVYQECGEVLERMSELGYQLEP
jgi:FkbM family methyltransferase